MENRQTWVKVLSLLAFSLVALNCVFAFANMGSTSFVQVFFILSLVAIVITSIFVTKDSKVPSSVIGASLLYFLTLLIRTVFFSIDAMVDFFRQLKLDNLSAKALEVTGNQLIEVNNKITKLRKTIVNDTFGEILDVFMLIFAFAVLAIAIYHVVRIVFNKKFSKTFLGKFTCFVVGKSSKCCSAVQEKNESGKVENEKEETLDNSTEANEQSSENESEEVALSEDESQEKTEEN